MGSAVHQAERLGHGLQQAPSQERQEEAALGVPGRPQSRGGECPVQHRGVTPKHQSHVDLYRRCRGLGGGQPILRRAQRCLAVLPGLNVRGVIKMGRTIVVRVGGKSTS